MAITLFLDEGLSTAHPEFAPVWAAFPQPTDPFPPLEARRAFWDEVVIPNLNKFLEPSLPSEDRYRLEDYYIPVEGTNMHVRTYIPTSSPDKTKTYPLLYWVHCGGWAIGNYEMDDYDLRIICDKLQVCAVSIDYRLTPESSSPTGAKDVYAGLKWAAANAGSFNADPKKGFVIAGQSAGGNLSLIAAHWARDDPFFANTPLTGQLVQYPPTCHPEAMPEEYKSCIKSMEECRDAPLLSKKEVYWFNELANPADPHDPSFSPLLFPSHANLPPLFFMSCGWDPLRDEGLLYHALVKEAGVETRMTMYPGVPHAFHMLFRSMKLAQKFQEETIEGMSWLFSKTPQ
uniref:Vibralactone Cyclase n=1 Tax=Boreostereum vibrans TaxID=1826779 RepID=A0A6P3CW43_9AGAM|nr:Chain A, Vibralactone Cyclase [Boreostereum vibrans]